VHTSRNGDLRSRIGVGGDTDVLLYVGRINGSKGLDVLLRALAPLSDAHLAIVGPDDHDGALELVLRLRDELGMRERVHVVGAVAGDEALRLYAQADAFVLPSRNENFGNVAAEAAAAGTPVVVTDRCGVAEFLRDRAALVVPLDADELRAAVDLVLHDAELRRRLAAGGRAVARELSWPNVARLQEGIYERALA
jgi:glycosyltransferase involved in cell wall biosynthesis